MLGSSAPRKREHLVFKRVRHGLGHLSFGGGSFSSFLYSMLLYYIILYYIILYYIILYFILFCSNLFCSILFYAIIFHHIILYYIILQAFGTSFSFCHKVSNAVHDMVLLAPLHCRTPSLFCFILCVKTTFHATC